jgi:hypothetical protein
MPFQSRSSMFARALSSSSSTALCPSFAARISGVHPVPLSPHADLILKFLVFVYPETVPLLSRLFTSAPASISVFTVSG